MNTQSMQSGNSKKGTTPPLSPPVTMVAEDDVFQAELLLRLFNKPGEPKNCVHVHHGQAVLDYLETHPHEIRVIFMDLQMPIMNGIEAMKIIKEKYPTVAVIFVTSQRDEKIMEQVMSLGAFDYLTKPFDGDRLTLTYRNALKFSALAEEREQARWRPNAPLRLKDLIGYDAGLREISGAARKIALTDAPVLIQGETGTGKEVFARAMHGESRRQNGPFVAINCGAIPENLIESILFGHEKGAFTGATSRTPGKFREAEKGTIFLDEIGEMPMHAQTTLLRVLQQHEVQPVGGHEAVPIDVRVISATNKDLQVMVKRGRFREDLFFRLNVVPLTLPPLRTRTEDIIPLARHFMERFSETEHFARKVLSREAELWLAGQNWPGNVRELENAIRRALILSAGNVLEVQDFNGTVMADIDDKVDVTPAAGEINARQAMMISLLNPQGHFRSLEDVNDEIFSLAHKHLDGNMFEIARQLGVARTTIYRRLNAKIAADPWKDGI